MSGPTEAEHAAAMVRELRIRQAGIEDDISALVARLDDTRRQLRRWTTSRVCGCQGATHPPGWVPLASLRAALPDDGLHDLDDVAAEFGVNLTDNEETP